MINHETFVIPGEKAEEYIIYAPIKGLLMTGNAMAVSNIAKSLMSDDWPSSLSSVQAALGKPNLFNPEERFDLCSKFFPVGVMLELTTNCNLRCEYCYASAGDSPTNISWTIAKKAIDLISDNAKEQQKNFSIFFHGRGEPTLNWQTLVRCSDYAKTVSNEKSKPLLRMATNGLLTLDQLNFVINNFETISLSLDGPEHIHDRHRKTMLGDGSFCHAYKTGQYLLEKGFPFGIKAVVTSANIRNLKETVKFFKEYFPGVSVGFEPVNEFGRCKKTGVSKPGTNEFIAHMFEIMNDSTGQKYSYSGVLQPEYIRQKFCGALKPTFGVHSDGKVVACVGVPLGNQYADAFCYGSFESDGDCFVFDSNKILELRQLLLKQFSQCDRCFAKWNCAGDCASYRLFQATHEIGEKGFSLRCLLNRDLLRKQLIIKSNKEVELTKCA